MLSTTTNCGVRAPANDSSRDPRHHLQVAQTFRDAGTLYMTISFFLFQHSFAPHSFAPICALLYPMIRHWQETVTARTRFLRKTSKITRFSTEIQTYQMNTQWPLSHWTRFWCAPQHLLVRTTASFGAHQNLGRCAPKCPQKPTFRSERGENLGARFSS